MRADQALSNGDATAPHVGGEGEGKGSAACRQAEGSRRIACESRVIQVRRSARPATSTKAGSVRAGPAGAHQAPVRVEARDDGPRFVRQARSTLADFRQTLLSQRTGLTIRLVGKARRLPVVKAFS